MIKRIIPSSGEDLPVIGLGTWKSFDVSGRQALEPLATVLNVMRECEASLIDSSPMYGNAESVVGKLTSDTPLSEQLFCATKVWTTGREAGIRQMESSFSKMQRTKMDLMQIHNLKDWKTHLKTLREWKVEGRIRYIGITHYTDSMHGELERIISAEDIDFVQFNYSVFSRNAEKSLLKSAADNGVATLINRPFGEGSAFARVRNKQLPEWAKEYQISSWSQFFLLYLISHPAVTAVIPATGNPVHARENFEIAGAELPSQAFRERMSAFVDSF